MQIYKLTNAQKVLVATVFAAAACASVLLVMQAPQLAIKGPHLSTAESIPVSQHTPLISKSDIASAQVQNAINSHSPQSMPQVATLTSWQMANVKASVPKITLSERISDYAIVELEQHPASFPAAGEQIQLPMLNGQKVIVNVESNTTNPNGDYTWSGHIEGFGSDYPVVMTYGEHSIFATITTPEGSYSMESMDGSGWLYKNPAEIELSNPGAKDFLEIDAAH